MVSQFSLSWDSYRSNICKGFSTLQQNGEFVDMTLAADGYYVKVHQVLMALVSPYIKQLISSAPCQHPVVFLNNVSHKTLSALLEYIYTGEVLVAAENLSQFAEAAKSLHIKGLENITDRDNVPCHMAENLSEDKDFGYVSGIKRLAVQKLEPSEKINLPVAAKKVCLKQETIVATPLKPPQLLSTRSTKNISQDYETTTIEDSSMQDDDDDMPEIDSQASDVNMPSSLVDTPSSNLQFTVSIRGSLQVILNRYIYNLHSCTRRSGVRRWRCVNYRNHKCMAFLITKGNVVVNRANLHNHPFHDKKILAKIGKKSVYSAIDDVQGYKEKEEAKFTDTEDFMVMDDFSDIADKSSDFMKGT